MDLKSRVNSGATTGIFIPKNVDDNKEKKIMVQMDLKSRRKTSSSPQSVEIRNNKIYFYFLFSIFCFLFVL